VRAAGNLPRPRSDSAAAVAASSTTTPISMLARMPAMKAARCAIIAPNTATASVPPT
jgi:hypothetical protein